jgi:threonine/homoserine/homoserine lactone efflux protein
LNEIYWLLFVGASLAVIISPGQDMILVMSRGIGQGPMAGVSTALGVSTGLLGHTVLATLGLGALLMASELAFTVLKFVGVAYLLYLGGRLVLSGEKRLDLQVNSSRTRSRLFLEGAFSNLSNPKITLFYFAFLPQFFPPTSQQPTFSIFVLGVTFALMTFVIKGPVGFFAGSLSGWFRSHPRVLGWMFRISGFALIALGVRLAF